MLALIIDTIILNFLNGYAVKLISKKGFGNHSVYFISFRQTSSFTINSGFTSCEKSMRHGHVRNPTSAIKLKLETFNEPDYQSPYHLTTNDGISQHGEIQRQLQLYADDQLGMPVQPDVADGEVHVCVTCKKSFGRMWHLKRHMATHLTKKPFVCPYCGYGLNVKDKLRLHIIKQHPDLPMPDLYALKLPTS